MSKEVVPFITDKELTKTQKNVFNREQMQLILSPTPEAHKYTRPAKGGGTWTYVTGVHVKKILNLAFGFYWDFEIVEYKFDLNIKQAYVLGKLIVRTTGQDNVERTVTKMQFGRVDIKFKTAYENGKKISTDQPLDIGNDLKAAATDALKKCAAEFGIASDIYGANEFKEVNVIEDSPEAKIKAIEELLDVEGLRITEEDRMAVERILEENEEEQYDRTLRWLNKRLPVKPKQQ